MKKESKLVMDINQPKDQIGLDIDMDSDDGIALRVSNTKGPTLIIYNNGKIVHPQSLWNRFKRWLNKLIIPKK